jgi:hypothetical protein
MLDDGLVWVAAGAVEVDGEPVDEVAAFAIAAPPTAAAPTAAPVTILLLRLPMALLRVGNWTRPIVGGERERSVGLVYEKR